MLFQKELGTLLDKSDRTVALVDPVAEATGLEEHRGVAGKAARLARADLATSMVTEMTALAGTMGRHYAEKEGLDKVREDDRVAAHSGPRWSPGGQQQTADLFRLEGLLECTPAGYLRGHLRVRAAALCR